MAEIIQNVLEVEGGPIAQGESEEWAYIMRFRDATTVSSPAATVFDNGGDDVTATVMPTGSASVITGTNKVQLPTLKLLDEGASPYRIVCLATVDGNKQSGTLVVYAFKEGEIG